MRPKPFVVGMLTASLAFLACGMATADAAETAQKETISVFGEGNLEVPEAFKRVVPKSRIIAHEFQAKAGEGKEEATARVTLMAAGGDVPANIKRWKGQFTGGDEKAQKSEEIKVGKWNVHIVDVNGSYAERTGGGPFAGGKVVNREDYAMTGVILVHPEGKKYFIKMIGPQSVVKANREALVKMVKSIQQ